MLGLQTQEYLCEKIWRKRSYRRKQQTFNISILRGYEEGRVRVKSLYRDGKKSGKGDKGRNTAIIRRKKPQFNVD